MAKKDHFDDPEEVEELAVLPRIKNAPLARPANGSKSKLNQKAKRSESEIAAALTDEGEDRFEFEFSYHASRHESEWIIGSLSDLYEHHWLDDVLRLVKGGKEASVYQCLANPATCGVETTYLAAKIYRPRQFRQLRKDHLYREGRANLDSEGHVIIDHGKLHAIARRTEYGQELLHASWIEHEYQTMEILHAAGADIPTPFTRDHNAILMSYIGDDEMAAPTLNSVTLTPQEARPLFERVLHNVELMLAHNRVHADLSAYNILYWDGEITLIDFPQAIAPAENHNALPIFERDISRICEYFARQGVRSRPRQLAANLWTAHKFSLQPEIHPRLLDAENEQDRKYWQTYANNRD